MDDEPVERLPRLQKVLAHAGLGSRQTCERLIADGRVTVDGRVVTALGHRVATGTAVIEVDGRRLPAPPELVHLALHKPPGVVSTMHDEHGRPCLTDVLGQERPGLFHVGRIDADSAGLVLLTNDGDLGHALADPRVALPHTYLVAVRDERREDLTRALRGAASGRSLHVEQVRVVAAAAGRTVVEVVLREGQTAALRRLLASAGHPVERLVQTAVGPVTLGDLAVGGCRPLTAAELAGLRHAARPAS